MTQRKKISAELKAKIALEAIKGRHTVSEIASRFSVHPNQVSQWKKQAQEHLPDLFSDRRSKVEADHEELASELYQQIGQLKVELDWLKKTDSTGLC
jgi:putative transposase